MTDDGTMLTGSISLDEVALTIEAPSAPQAFPLSHGQQALWLLQQIEPTNAAYNVARAVRIRGPLDTAVVRRVFQRIVDRHPALRTTFELRDGRPVQVVHDRITVPFTVEDASDWTEAEIRTRLAAEVSRPFDLARGPLFRVHVFTRSDNEAIGLLNLQHTVSDLWSKAIILYEMHALYNEEVHGVPAGLRPYRETYTDFVARQARLLDGPEGERLQSYWTTKLAGAPPVLDLPTDHPRPRVAGFRIGCVSHRFGPALVARLEALAAAQDTNMYTLMFAAFQTLLHRYSGQEEFLVGTPQAGRGMRNAGTIGYFVNSLAIRAELGGDPTFVELLGRVSQTVGEALEHGTYPFPLLVEQLQLDRDPGRPPLFQVMFAWQKTISLHDGQSFTPFILQETGGALPLGDNTMESLAVDEQVGPFDLTLLMAESGEDVVATLEYSRTLYERPSMDRLLGHLHSLLEGIVEHPTARVSELPLLTAAEREQMLVGWNDTAAEYPSDRCVHQLFEEQAARTPEAVAVTFEDTILTYAELDARANQVAHHLRALGVGPEQLVGLCVERSPEMVIGLLGILKAGGAYLPLDPTYPRERLAGMLDDAAVSVVLTQAALRDELPGAIDRLVCLDSEWSEIEGASRQPPTVLTAPDNLAYVIYTSGSTGRPKGVLLHHRGLVNFALANIRAAEVTPDSRVLQFASFSFDASVAETFTALLAGASLHLARRETLLSPPDLLRLMRQRGITTVTLPPSMLKLLPAEELPTLRTILSAGENCTGEIVARWAPGRRLLNAYGPTEATIGPTWFLANDVAPDAPTIPIGRPIQNMRVYVLDRHRHPVPIGIPGELYVGGVGVARGYLNREELTAEKFVPDPFAGSDAPAGRLYRTGDLARWREDGNLEFIGRIDSQVKLRGFRVELGEIEASLRQHEHVGEAVALVREDLPGHPRLVAYIVPSNGTTPGGGELRSFLQSRLPEHMLPALYVPIERLPLSPNGKVDVRALPAPVGARPELDSAYVLPRSDLERRVAALWAEALQVEQVGIHDNFFDLGGHSLLAVRIHGSLQEMFGREFSMVELFRYPTIATLVDYLNRETAAVPAAQAAQDRADKMKSALGRQQQLSRRAVQRRTPPRGNNSGGS